MITHVFKLDCAFLHKKLVRDLMHPFSREILDNKIEATSKINGYVPGFLLPLYAEEILHILRTKKTPSLDEILLKNQKITQGDLLWIETDFYFKDAVKARVAYDNGVRPSYSTFHTKLTAFDNLRITGHINAEHFSADSTTHILSGKRNVFMFFYIQELKVDEIIIRPIVIGSKMIGGDASFSLPTNYIQVYAEDIDEFSKVKTTPRPRLPITLNKDISEQQVKKLFAEIIFENNIPKDWGGEKSDLFTNHIHVNGKRCNAAFLFKGPAKFEPMTVRNLGKNGDQITRLYEEPAEIYILHHCHYIKPEIVKTMTAFSARFFAPSRFCLIDGEDTLRILRAYKKI